jgi:hypothetical protein
VEPYLKTFILCDNVTKDILGRPVFSGVLNKIKAVTFPSYIPICIVTEWVLERGTYKEEIKVLTGNREQTYFKVPSRTFNCERDIAVKSFISPLKNFPLSSHGGLWFQAFLNDKLFLDFPIAVETKVSKIIGKI